MVVPQAHCSPYTAAIEPAMDPFQAQQLGVLQAEAHKVGQDYTIVGAPQHLELHLEQSPWLLDARHCSSILLDIQAGKVVVRWGKSHWEGRRMECHMVVVDILLEEEALHIAVVELVEEWRFALLLFACVGECTMRPTLAREQGRQWKCRFWHRTTARCYNNMLHRRHNSNTLTLDAPTATPASRLHQIL